MNDTMKSMLVVLAIIYFIAPVDLCPGPVDDIIVLAASLIAQKKIKA